ncbi:hypothetical protein CAEBREN_32058 [Caenorhabditis brenneri]|uniref:Uncharacterized protein n=1 Tax=Caenorhabditis brenneri TaxID=135651 RepID=G0NKN0_CAEBE|nr:hypothetical protein CAEBREN_32058 [Caenorhabditis brenneri]
MRMIQMKTIIGV